MADKEKKKKKKKSEPEYDLDRQPLWVTNPDFHERFQLTGEGRNGQRAYLYRHKNPNKEFVVIANKDWEKEDKNLPGKSIRLTLPAMDALCTEYLRSMYDYELKLEE